MINKRKIASAILITLLVAQTTAGSQPKAIEPIPVEYFKPIQLTKPTGLVKLPTPIPRDTPSPFKRVEVSVPTPKPKVVPKIKKYVRPSRAEVKAYVRSKIGDKQFACINKLWTGESGWRYNAYNEGSGAYGIPQALPGSKMAKKKNNGGPDWKTNPITQVNWGMNYVKVRYGSACAALAYKRKIGWY